MKKIFFVFCVVIYLMSSENANAQTTAANEYKYPQWAKDLRRTEIVAFGIFPFAWLVSTVAVDLYRSSQHGWDQNYYPWPLKPAGAPAMTNDEYVLTITTAASISVGLALVDFLIIHIKRHKKQTLEAKLPKGTPIIERRNMTNGELIEDENDTVTDTPQDTNADELAPPQDNVGENNTDINTNANNDANNTDKSAP